MKRLRNFLKTEWNKQRKQRENDMAESMQGLHRSHRCAEVTTEMAGARVTLMGWVQKARNKGGIVFVDLRDRSGIIQLIFENGTIDPEGFEKAGKLRSEFVIAVTGTVEKRQGAVNKNLATGEIEIRAESLRILSEADVPPFPIEENSKTKDEVRLKYRYLDLRRPDLQRNLMLRSKVAMLTRQFFEKEGFLEIETPILTKSTPEGARDYLVPSRVHPGEFYGLPQSPQILKQLLMCSGYDRYIQIAKCFRDEDLRADRQPEFTQIDMELSFVDVDDVIDVNERYLAFLFKEVMDIEVPLPIQRMSWQEAMDRFGSDKPDLRFGMELKNVSDLVKDCGFGVFTTALENGGSVRGINVSGQGSMPRKKIDKLVEFAKGYGAKGLAYIALSEDGKVKSSFAKFMSEEEMQSLIQGMDGKPGDLLLFAADKNKVVYDVLGALRVELAKQLELFDKDEFKFVWITEFPLLEWSEEENRYTAMHHPFTMLMEEDLPLLDTEPGKVRAKAYDIVLNGNEIGGGSVRIHQNDIQEKMFEALGFTKEAAYEQFGFLLNAFKYGVPPHAGLAYGLDRLVMLMAKADSIREVIAFPKVKDASCLMTETPGPVSEAQLEELGLQIKPKQEN
nr:aspartate--tRNA ligase [Blautia sp. An249]